MNRPVIAVLLAVLPAMALPQAQALDQARNTQAVQDAGTLRTTTVVDAASAPTPPEDAKGAVDLNAAASQLEGQSAPAAERAGDVPAGTYVIQRGDTLWDLSAKFLQSPWYWPKLWSYNPQIENPHWIYPGNPLRLAPAGAEAPVRVATAAPEEMTAPRELEDLTQGKLGPAQQLDEADAVTVGGLYKIAAARPKGPAVMRNSFVTASQLDASGTVVAAFEEKMILVTGDRIYGRFKDPAAVKVGDRFSIYRTEGHLFHPVTHRSVGYKTLILATARVTAVEPDKAATLVITSVNDGVERGDKIGADVGAARRPLFTRPNRTSVDGVVVGVQPAIVTGAAEYNVVYLDKGTADGVDVGNTFEVVRSGDPYSDPVDKVVYQSKLPREVIGQVVVFDAQERASSAYVRRSLMELLVGDIVEMRPAAAPAPVNKGG
jgi:LysM repeat protein